MDPALQRELSVVIPAFNEEGGVGSTLRDLRARLPEVEIIVVDDGSRDATRAHALEVPGVRVIAHLTNRGYGASLKTGMSLVERRYVAWFDADNEHRVEDLEAMAARIHHDDLSAVIGRRRHPGVSVVRVVGKLSIRILARSLGVDVGRDLNCGLRIFRRSIIRRYLPLLPDQFSASLTSTMVLVERGHPLGFHDIDVNPRIGTSKVRIRDGFSTMMLVMRFVMLFAPMRFFFAPGLFTVTCGIAYGVVRAVATGRGIPVAAALVTMSGLFMAMLGLVADQISQLRFAQLQLQSSLLESTLSDPDIVEMTIATASLGSPLSAATPSAVPGLLGPGSDAARLGDDAPAEGAQRGDASQGLVETNEART